MGGERPVRNCSNLGKCWWLTWAGREQWKRCEVFGFVIYFEGQPTVFVRALDYCIYQRMRKAKDNSWDFGLSKWKDKSFHLLIG